MNQFLKFNPILKDKIWGGEKLKNLLNKTTDRSDIGESWEISDVEGDTSVVSNGALKGIDLKELIAIYKGDLVGEKVYAQFAEKFPLLIKFIDAKEALSIQLHPHDDLAKKRHNSFGKTEMWYVMQADEKANLIVGFQEEVTSEEYKRHLENKSLTDILNIDEVNEGDVYFIPTGRVHAIGAGVLLAEIQQTSDITYRIYDWDRQDSEGNYRDLHTDEAIDAIDYTVKDSYSTNYQKQPNSTTEIVSCPYFITNILPITSVFSVDHSDKDSFVIYICVKGKATFIGDEQRETIQRGETILVPNTLKHFSVNPIGNTELLEVYIK